MDGENRETKHNIKGNNLLPLFALIMAIAALGVTVWILIMKPGQGYLAANSGSSSAQSSQNTASVDSYAAQTQSSQVVAANINSASDLNTTSIDNPSYFDKSVFIGDSITAGLELYKLLDSATVIADNGMSAGNALTSKIKTNGTSAALISTVTQNKPTKIFILLGSNDVSWMSTDSFIKNYGKIIDDLKQKCSDASIYVQSVFPVSAKYEAKKPAFSNSKIDEYNSALKNLCDSKGVKYEDVSSVLKTSDGKLNSDLSSDGLNIKRGGYIAWLNYLSSHN